MAVAVVPDTIAVEHSSTVEQSHFHTHHPRLQRDSSFSLVEALLHDHIPQRDITVAVSIAGQAAHIPVTAVGTLAGMATADHR